MRLAYAGLRASRPSGGSRSLGLPARRDVRLHHLEQHDLVERLRNRIRAERRDDRARSSFPRPVAWRSILGYGLGGFAWMAPVAPCRRDSRRHRPGQGSMSPIRWPSSGAVFVLHDSARWQPASRWRGSSSSRAGRISSPISCSVRENSSPGHSSRARTLPGPLHALSNCLPVSHALDALRASALGAATLRDILPSLGLTILVVSADLRAHRRTQLTEGGICSQTYSGDLDLY